MTSSNPVTCVTIQLEKCHRSIPPSTSSTNWQSLCQLAFLAPPLLEGCGHDGIHTPCHVICSTTAHNNGMSADVLIGADVSTGSGHIDRRQLYQPQGGHINNRRAYRWEAGVLTESGRIDSRAGVSTVGGYVDSRSTAEWVSTGGGCINNRVGISMRVSTGGRYIDKGQVYRQGVGISTGDRHINSRRACRQQSGCWQGAGISTTGWAYQCGCWQEAGISTRGGCIERGRVYLQCGGCIDRGRCMYQLSCRYKSMYLSSLPMKQSPCVFTRVPVQHSHIHTILPSITGYNQLLTGYDRD